MNVCGCSTWGLWWDLWPFAPRPRSDPTVFSLWPLPLFTAFVCWIKGGNIDRCAFVCLSQKIQENIFLSDWFFLLKFQLAWCETIFLKVFVSMIFLVWGFYINFHTWWFCFHFVKEYILSSGTLFIHLCWAVGTDCALNMENESRERKFPLPKATSGEILVKVLFLIFETGFYTHKEISQNSPTVYLPTCHIIENCWFWVTVPLTTSVSQAPGC